MNQDDSLHRCIRFFETMSVESLQQLDTVYATDAYFKDPFNEVNGIESITGIYRHMFNKLEGPRFLITKHVAQGDEAFLTWDFLFYMKHYSSALQCIRGATHLRFGDDGLIHFHRDYWDAAEELYEKVPLLGMLMRYLKRTAGG